MSDERVVTRVTHEPDTLSLQTSPARLRPLIAHLLVIRVRERDGVDLVVVDQTAAVSAPLPLVLLVPEAVALDLPEHSLRFPPDAALAERALVRVIPRTLLAHPLVHVHSANEKQKVKYRY